MFTSVWTIKNILGLSYWCRFILVMGFDKAMQYYVGWLDLIMARDSYITILGSHWTLSLLCVTSQHYQLSYIRDQSVNWHSEARKQWSEKYFACAYMWVVSTWWQHIINFSTYRTFPHVLYVEMLMSVQEMLLLLSLHGLTRSAESCTARWSTWAFWKLWKNRIGLGLHGLDLTVWGKQVFSGKRASLLGEPHILKF